MRSVRLNVFETNSSATHAVSISGQYATVEDIPNRDPNTLPALDEDGNLVIDEPQPITKTTKNSVIMVKGLESGTEYTFFVYIRFDGDDSEKIEVTATTKS